MKSKNIINYFRFKFLINSVGNKDIIEIKNNFKAK